MNSNNARSDTHNVSYGQHLDGCNSNSSPTRTK